MNAIKSSFALVVVALAATFTSLACDKSGGGNVEPVGGSSTPPVGSHVDVHFKRNYLGLASDKATLPIAEGMASSGVLKGITNDFVVLQVHGEANRELWIPREAVLLLDVKRVK